MNQGARQRVLIVDDQVESREVLRQQLTRWYEVLVAGDAVEARERLQAHGQSIDAVILELKLPGVNGLDLLAEIRATYPLIALLVVSASVSVDDVVRANNLGAGGFLVKPVTSDTVAAKLDSAIRGRWGSTLRELEEHITEMRLKLEALDQDLLTLDNDYKANRQALLELRRDLAERLRRAKSTVDFELVRIRRSTERVRAKPA